MCEGDCKVQFYDVDVSEVVVTPDSGNGADCPKSPRAEVIADALQAYFVVIGCKETDCECVLFRETEFEWTDWQAYDVPAGKEIVIVKPDFTSCKYTLTGTYYVSSSIGDGVCMKKPKDWKGHKRRKSRKVRPKNAGEKTPEEPKKKVGPKKAGYKIRRLRRAVRSRLRGSARRLPQG